MHFGMLYCFDTSLTLCPDDPPDNAPNTKGLGSRISALRNAINPKKDGKQNEKDENPFSFILSELISGLITGVILSYILSLFFDRTKFIIIPVALLCIAAVMLNIYKRYFK